MPRMPLLVAATIERVRGDRRTWAVAADRRVLVLGEHGGLSRPAGDMPLPGSARPLAIEAGTPGPSVLCDDGEIWTATPRGWVALENLIGGRGKVRMRVTSGFCYEPGKDANTGDVIEVAPDEARRLIEQGRAVPEDDA